MQRQVYEQMCRLYWQVCLALSAHSLVINKMMAFSVKLKDYLVVHEPININALM